MADLHWRRMRISINAATLEVDTGLTLASYERAFRRSSATEPQFDTDGAIGSRIQVIPLAPLNAWLGGFVGGGTAISHGEPFLDATTGTIHVVFTAGRTAGAEGVVVPATFNVLFWNPHSLSGPGAADTYNP